MNSATYKKEEVKTYLPRGRPNLFFLILQGHPNPSTPTRPCGGPVLLCPCRLCFPKVNRCCPLALLLSRRGGYTPAAWRSGVRLCPGAPGCNLTRNIQADGVPMVHRAPGESILQGSFSTIGHRSYASENAPG